MQLNRMEMIDGGGYNLVIEVVNRREECIRTNGLGVCSNQIRMESLYKNVQCPADSVLALKYEERSKRTKLRPHPRCRGV